MICEEIYSVFDDFHEVRLAVVPPSIDGLLEARDVALDVGLRELAYLSIRCFEWLNSFMMAMLDDQGHGQVLLGQLQVLVVKPAKLRPGDRDLLVVRVDLAADVEQLRLLFFIFKQISNLNVNVASKYKTYVLKRRGASPSRLWISVASAIAVGDAFFIFLLNKW